MRCREDGEVRLGCRRDDREDDQVGAALRDRVLPGEAGSGRVLAVPTGSRPRVVVTSAHDHLMTLEYAERARPQLGPGTAPTECGRHEGRDAGAEPTGSKERGATVGRIEPA